MARHILLSEIQMQVQILTPMMMSHLQEQPYQYCHQGEASSLSDMPYCLMAKGEPKVN
jgi:hypothetical protein